MAKVTVIMQGLTALSHALGDKWIRLGRADGNTFQIPADSVSGRHCEIRLQGEDLLVRDLQSTNGTFVNGQKISEATVKPGQIFRLGEVAVRFEMADEQAGITFTSKMLMANTSAQSAKKPSPTPMAEAHFPAANVVDPAKKHSVLFVDDSLAFLETFAELCTVFSQQAWDIQTATSADRALAILQAKPVELVVLDVGLPMMDGLQLLSIIRHRHPGIKIAVMTGSATEAKRADALANGAELFMEKPVTADGIRSIFNLLNGLLLWTRLDSSNSRPVTEPPGHSPSINTAESTLDEDFVVVATYDGQWNPVADNKK